MSLDDGGVLAGVQAGAGFAGARVSGQPGLRLDTPPMGRGWLASGRAGFTELFMAFVASELSIEMIAALRGVVPKVKQQDNDLAKQLLRAANSVALNLGESELSDPGNRRARLCSAAGSAKETLTALQAAQAWGYITAEQLAPAAALLRRIIAILWKMTRG